MYVLYYDYYFIFFFSSRRRHTRSLCDWSSDVCSSDLTLSMSRLEGRVVRSMMVDKLRGFRLRRQGALFTLDRGRFTPLPRSDFILMVTCRKLLEFRRLFLTL